MAELAQKPEGEDRLWQVGIAEALDVDGVAIDMQAWKVLRCHVAPAKSLMKKFETLQVQLKHCQALLSKISPKTKSARDLMGGPEQEEHRIYIMAVKVLGGCMVTQATTKKLAPGQTRDGELFLVRTFVGTSCGRWA